MTTPVDAAILAEIGLLYLRNKNLESQNISLQGELKSRDAELSRLKQPPNKSLDSAEGSRPQ
jgi:hypothetical protein